MNSAVMQWARRQKAGGATEKCVLMLLGAEADDKGVSLIARAELAALAEISRSAVERVLQTLCANGLIFRAAAAELIEIRLVMDRGARR